MIEGERPLAWLDHITLSKVPTTTGTFGRLTWLGDYRPRGQDVFVFIGGDLDPPTRST